MDLPQPNENPRMTLDELFRKTFSSLLAKLMDTFSIFEEQSSSTNDSKDPES